MLKMFDALLPYYGNKRKLCPIIFNYLTKHISRDNWCKSEFYDVFLGSGAVSLYAKAQGFEVYANDSAKRSYIAGKSLIENDSTLLTDDDIYKLFKPAEENKHLIENNFSPDVFSKRHAQFLDNAFSNARRDIDKYLLLKYIFHLRPYSKFTSPNAFNRPFEEGRFDDIKPTYTTHIKDNLKSPLSILKQEKEAINKGIFYNGHKHHIFNCDVFDFVYGMQANVAYFDPPYANTMSYEKEYEVLDTILGDTKPKSKFSCKNGMDLLDAVLKECTQTPLWIISYSNAAGKNDLQQLVDIVSKYRGCYVKEIDYVHCGAIASKEHKQNCKEWIVIADKVDYN